MSPFVVALRAFLARRRGGAARAALRARRAREPRGPLWRSWWDGRSRAALRIGLPAIMAVEQLVEAFQVAAQAADPTRFPPSGALSRALASMPEAAWGIYAMIVLGLALVARDRSPVKAGLWALAWAALLSEWQTQIFGSPSRNAFFPGAALLGWVLGQLWATTVLERDADGARDASRHRDLRERLGEAGALACIVAAYVGSCLSKLLAAGTSWADAAQVRALLLWQEPLADWAWLHAWRDAIIEDPARARAAAIATLVIEGGALLLLLGPRLRLVWAALLCGLHLTITLLCTMPYLEPIALLGLLAVPWPAPAAAAGANAHGVQTPARTTAAADSLDRPALPLAMAVVLGCVVLLAWAVAPFGWRGH
jgi:hypothetical protein